MRDERPAATLHGEYILCEWGGLPGYVVAEKDVLPCLLDFFAVPHRPCMAIGSDLCERYGLKHHAAYETHMRELMSGGKK